MAIKPAISNMSFRKAFLILGLIVLVIAAVGYALQGRVALPNDALEYLIIAGLIVAFIPNLKDSVEFIQGMFSPHEQKTIALPPIDPDRYVQIRRAALQNLRSSWVEGVLKKSLHQGIWLQLGLTSQPHAISRRTLRTNKQETPIAADKSIETVFNEAGRKLLILGDPGSGKTMQLLQLAKALIATAKNDSAAPLPFVFNLSSWVQKQEPLADWLVEELHQQYQLSRQFAQQLITTKPLTLLLDGLDEVASEHRPACVSAINTFLTNHDTDLAVCSRLKEYDTLSNKLNLSRAICILPLTDDQIHHFLNHPGLELQAVRATLAKDPTLHKLAQTPLMLHIMAVAYAGLTPTELGHLNTTEARQRHIFGRYIDYVLYHRLVNPNTSNYPIEQAIHWVRQLAASMLTNKQTIFYIERLQPTWSSSIIKKWFTVVSSSLSALLYGLPIGLLVGLQIGTLWGALSGLMLGLCIGIIIGFRKEILLVEVIRWKRPNNFNWLLNILFFGSVWAFFFSHGGKPFMLLGALLGGLSFGLLEWLETTKVSHYEQPNLGIKLSRSNAVNMTLSFGLIGGLLIGLFALSLEGVVIGVIVGALG
ncbi:MAG: NACHT domain-containing protein, partial [Anaerolineales bacterium]|nr:NACHT domain-containing protein [Anaerolineales bacterium]